jgi:hypothetical protein
VAPAIVINSFAVAMALADGCCAWVDMPAAASIIASTAGLAAFLMASVTLIYKLHLARDSRLFDDFYTVWAANNGHVREANKQTMLHHAGYA